MSESGRAIERRRDQEPDIVIGPMAMWVGTGEGQSWALPVGTLEKR